MNTDTSDILAAASLAAVAAATAMLLSDPAATAALATRGRRLYQARFALEHTLDALLDVAAVA